MAAKYVSTDVEGFFLALDAVLSFHDFGQSLLAKHPETLRRIVNLQPELEDILGAALTLRPLDEYQDSRTLTALQGFETKYIDASVTAGFSAYETSRLSFGFSQCADLVAVHVDHTPVAGFRPTTQDPAPLPSSDAIESAEMLLRKSHFIVVTPEQLAHPYTGVSRGHNGNLIADGEWGPKDWLWRFFGY